MKERSREEFANRIIAYDIVLFGAGDRARYFYTNYEKVLNIKFCVANDLNKEKIVFENGRCLSVVKPSEIIQELDENKFIIICVDDYMEIENQLISYGLTMGKDFLHYSIFELLMTKKKIAILYGVCYMRPICQYMKKSVEFLKDYESFYWLSYKKMTINEYEMFICLLKVCDLYIYNPAISRQERVIEEGILSNLPESCIRVKLPSVGAEACHPQAIKRNNRDRSYNVVSATWAYGPFTCQDWCINQMIEEGKELVEIRETIKDVSFFEPEWVKHNYDIQFRKIELQEINSDIKISDYLRDHHRKKRLFHDGSHISNEPICEVANRLLIKIGYNPLGYSNEIDTLMIYASEVPIYPSVIRALKLNIYDVAEPMYKLYTLQGYKKVSFDEYIEEYYNFGIQMKKFIEQGYFYEKR